MQGRLVLCQSLPGSDVALVYFDDILYGVYVSVSVSSASLTLLSLLLHKADMTPRALSA